MYKALLFKFRRIYVKGLLYKIRRLCKTFGISSFRILRACCQAVESFDVLFKAEICPMATSFQSQFSMTTVLQDRFDLFMFSCIEVS